ncbi:sugar transferase [Tessaracoccus massiliensis]|uniref:sugar transferase n=1 Tax=Tessaracoccus massiliensis TaxID=1522311 RepID=UPI001C567476|nr:sugar transferase [Tessaracoccus massiliensis]
MLDIVASLAALPLFAAVSVVLVPLIRLSDGGPALYVSQRRGMDGRHFTMYKFRTMKVNAPELRNADLSTVTSDSDPRVTKVGRVLRGASLDELPQLINVLKGDMSLVGPRPNLTRQTWDELTDIERKRLRARPGITGWAQAELRNSGTTAEKYMLDARYVDELSFVLDFRILLKTVMSVITAKNINAQR